MKTGDYVEVKEAKGSAGWVWCGRMGHVLMVDVWCTEVRTDDGENVRDVHDHFRPAKVL